MKPLSDKQKERILHCFQFMEWKYITDAQLDLVESFEKQFKRSNRLSERQIEILESIFKQAAEDA